MGDAVGGVVACPEAVVVVELVAGRSAASATALQVACS